jgi:hypothetical protein
VKLRLYVRGKDLLLRGGDAVGITIFFHDDAERICGKESGRKSEWVVE